MKPPRRARGIFVTFEGIEGAGKTTQIARLAAALRAAGVDTALTREPGATGLGRALRALLLAKDSARLAPCAELLLYAADRAQHLEEVVLPALARGAVVLCDRYLDATLAYQGFGRGLGVKPVLDVHRQPPLDLRPRRTILLDADPAKGLARARRRDRAGRGERGEGRMEAESLAFHRRVRAGYLTLARKSPRRFRVVPAAGSVEDVESRVRAALTDLFPELAARKRKR